MKQTLQLIGAPTAMQPGGYVPEAYKNRTEPSTPSVELTAQSAKGRGWRIELQWACPQPVASIANETDLFPDAAALMVPVVADAPWITMGQPDKPVEAALWRADRKALYRMQAEGLGTMQRSEAPSGWSAQSQWADGVYRLVFQIKPWAALDQHGLLGIALWRGAEGDRGGLKSVSGGWVAVS